MQLAQIIGVKDVNNEDELYDKLITFISRYEEIIKKHIRCFLDEDRYIADSEDNVILLYILYDKYKNELHKGRISKCIEYLGDEDSNKLLKVGKLLSSLFRAYYNDYYSIVLRRAESFIKSIDEKNEPIISNMIERNKNNLGAERSKNDLKEKILLVLHVLLIYALLGFTIYQEIRILDLEGEIQQLEKQIKELEKQIKELKSQSGNQQTEKQQSGNQEKGSNKGSKKQQGG